MTKEKEGGCSCWLKGCAGVFILFLIVTIGGGIYVYSNRDAIGRSIAATGVELLAEGMTQDLPAAEKKEIMGVVHELTQKIRDGKMGAEQAGKVAEQIFKSPVVVAILGNAIEAKFYTNSSLSDDEKKDASLQINRLYQAALKKSAELAEGADPETISALPEPVVDELSQIFFEKNAQNQWTMKQVVNEAELRRAIELVKTACGDLGIPEEQIKVDIAGELRKAIQKAEEEVVNAKTNADGADSGDAAQ